MSDKEKTKPRRSLVFWGLCSVLIFVAMLLPYQQVVEVKIKNEQVLGQTVGLLPIVPDFRPVLKPEAEQFTSFAEIAYALDLKTGTLLYQKNSTKPWPMASLAKLMTALVVVNTISIDEEMKVGDNTGKFPQPLMGLVSGEEIAVSDLLQGMLIMSANDAAYALAIGVAGETVEFVRLMNSMAEKLGLPNTHFQNPAGFDDLSGFSTAEDMAKLTLEFLSFTE